MSKVSVIIPVYNAEEYLRQCLDSDDYLELDALEKIYKKIVNFLLNILCVKMIQNTVKVLICHQYRVKLWMAIEY